MNSVNLIGRLTKAPELSYTKGENSTAVAKFTVAIDRPKRSGEDNGADFIRCVAFGKIAENCDRYLDKGRQVGISGRIQTGSYKDRDDRTVYTTDVIAERVEFIGASQKSAPAKRDEAETETHTRLDDWVPEDSFAQVEEDIPF